MGKKLSYTAPKLDRFSFIARAQCTGAGSGPSDSDNPSVCASGTTVVYAICTGNGSAAAGNATACTSNGGNVADNVSTSGAGNINAGAGCFVGETPTNPANCVSGGTLV